MRAASSAAAASVKARMRPWNALARIRSSRACAGLERAGPLLGQLANNDLRHGHLLRMKSDVSLDLLSL